MSDRAQQWKKKTYENVKFPSGNLADLKRPSMFALMSNDGNIPNSFYAAMFNTDGKTGQLDTSSLSAEEKVEYMKTMMYMADKVAREAFISPQIVDEPDYENDQISIDDVQDQDKEFLLDWVMGGGDLAQSSQRFPASKQRKRLAATSKK